MIVVRERCEQVVDEVCAGICASCHFDGTELSGLAVKADHPVEKEEVNYNQDQDQDQDEDQVSSSDVIDDPGPGGNSEPSWLDIALDEHRKGNLEPFEVELGPMPARAGSVMRAIAEHMRF